MRNSISNFPKQLKEAVQLSESASFSLPNKSFQNILLCGMGGSGISSEILAVLIKQQLNIPFVFNKDYRIPSWVSEETLVILASYSGNTEEVLTCYESIKTTNAEIAIVTSGGELFDLAKANNHNYIKIPGGEEPRACIGYSLVQHIALLGNYGLIDASLMDSVKSSINLLNSESNYIQTTAKKIAPSLKGQLSVLYSSPLYYPANLRFKQQINENSKALAYTGVAPEITHNEIVGWTEKHDYISVVAVHDDSDNPRTSERLKYIQNLVSPYVSEYIVVKPKGESVLEKMIYLIHLFDWISLEIAELKEVDPVEVNAIKRLKELLASL